MKDSADKCLVNQDVTGEPKLNCEKREFAIASPLMHLKVHLKAIGESTRSGMHISDYLGLSCLQSAIKKNKKTTNKHSNIHVRRVKNQTNPELFSGKLLRKRA